MEFSDFFMKGSPFFSHGIHCELVFWQKVDIGIRAEVLEEKPEKNLRVDDFDWWYGSWCSYWFRMSFYWNWSLLADVMREGILELWRRKYADIAVEDGEYILTEGFPGKASIWGVTTRDEVNLQRCASETLERSKLKTLMFYFSRVILQPVVDRNSNSISSPLRGDAPILSELCRHLVGSHSSKDFQNLSLLIFLCNVSGLLPLVPWDFCVFSCSFMVDLSTPAIAMHRWIQMGLCCVMSMD